MNEKTGLPPLTPVEVAHVLAGVVQALDESKAAMEDLVGRTLTVPMRGTKRRYIRLGTPPLTGHLVEVRSEAAGILDVLEGIALR